MLFSSITFIFLFLPIVCLLYLLVKNKLRNYVLLFASILFYAWGEPKYLYIMLLTIIINYFGAVCLNRFQKYKKPILTATVLADLGFLVYFKYFNFIMRNISTLFTSDFNVVDVVMPIGISFYTFQAMSYLIDVYRGDVKVQKNILKLALYICLFPQLIAGPIVQYTDIKTQIDNRKENFEKVVYGIKRFILGLAKKVLIANTLGAIADKVFADVYGVQTSVAWIGAIAYSFQLFYDFSGYSDMAIGLGSIFGFKFSENFNYPYISKSITEFWRRWHISLSSWFKNYLYIPLGGNRKGVKHTYFNLFIVFFATGIWHGASWNFIVWGLWHGMFNIIEKLTGWHKKEGKKIAIIQHIYTLFVVLIGWVIFRADNLVLAEKYIKNMFGLCMTKPLFNFAYYMDVIEIIMFIVAILCAMPIFKNFANKPKNKYLHIVLNIWIMILFILSISSIAASTYNPFIYFRF